MNWRVTLHMNGLSLSRCQSMREYFRRQIEGLQRRDSAFGKPYIKGFRA